MHNANYHKTCRNKYDKYQFDRAVTKIAKDKTTPLTSKNTRSSFESRNYLNICFFCDTQDDATNLRLGSTMKLDANVRSAAQQLGDEKLLATMNEGGMVAIEAKYHIKCLNNMYNKLRKQNNESDNSSNEDSINYEMALVKLIDIVNNTIQNATEVPVFKLSELNITFNHILIIHGTHDFNIHSTRLKDHLLQHIPGLELLKKGRCFNLGEIRCSFI